MSGIGIPVLPGFTIEVCTYYYDHERSDPEALLAQVDAAIAQIENETGARFADPANPLLVPAVGCAVGIHARHDGYGAESGAE